MDKYIEWINIFQNFYRFDAILVYRSAIAAFENRKLEFEKFYHIRCTLDPMKLKRSDDYFFDSSSDVRAAFELGIKFGALYHTSIGRPIRNDPETIHRIEQGIAASISCQPYVKAVSVKILGDLDSSSEFKYGEITGGNMQAEIVVQYKEIIITGKLEWIDDLNYPLMYITDIRKVQEKNR